MEQPQIAKIFDKIKCPHCNGEVHIGFHSMIPQIVTVATEQQLKEAKTEIKTRIEQINFTKQEDKIKVLQWLEGTPIDHSDIEATVKQIIEDYSETSQKINEEEISNNNQN